MLKWQSRQGLVWRIATSEFVACSLITFLQVAGAGTNTPVSGDSFALPIERGTLESLLSRSRGHVEQYNVFELLSDRSYDMRSAFLRIATLDKLIGTSGSYCLTFTISTRGKRAVNTAVSLKSNHLRSVETMMPCCPITRFLRYL